MMYFGGKARIAKPLAAFLNEQITDTYYEPFVGAAWVYQYIKSPHKFASDIHEDLILMWNAVMNGWVPPTEVSEELYQDLRKSPPSPIRGFAGFACSFGGKWFGGYARRNTGQRNYALSGSRSVISKRDRIAQEHYNFGCRGYIDLVPASNNSVIYCDPPYKDTTKYSNGRFDSESFWNWVRDMGRFCKIYVSEYEAPEWAKLVMEVETKTSMRNAAGEHMIRMERLYTV